MNYDYNGLRGDFTGVRSKSLVEGKQAFQGRGNCSECFRASFLFKYEHIPSPFNNWGDRDVFYFFIYNMELSNLKEQLEKDLKRGIVPPQVLLDRFIMVDEDFRKAPAYVDTHNYPFYYHLGKLIQPKRLLEISFGVGLASGCFFRSCKSVEDSLFIHVKGNEYYNPWIGVKNIRSVYRCKYFVHVMPIEVVTENIKGPFDLVIINETMNFDTYRNVLDRVFEEMSLDGFVIMNFLNDKSKEAFQVTAKVHNRNYVVIKTRYGTGVFKK